MSRVKKIVASALLSIFLLVSLSVPYAHAQASGCTGTWYCQSFRDWYQKVYPEGNPNPNEIFGERYTAAQVQWIIYSLAAIALNSSVGDDNSDMIACLMRTHDPMQCLEPIRRAVSDASAGNSNSPAFAFKFPAPFSPSSVSGVGYVRQKLAQFHIVKEVSAQQAGFGFFAVNPIQKMWVAARNAAYFFLVIAIIVMAFMIMFRVKLSPQTVITVQSALPKIIIGLILITFSYAIAGFMVDLMYVVIGLITAIFVQSGFFQPTWAEMFNWLSGTQNSVFSVLLQYLIWTIIAVLMFILNLDIIAFLLGLVFLIITVVVVFILLFKIAWMLMKTFFTLILQIAFAPFIILGGAVGIGEGFVGWLKNLAATLAVFVAVGPLFAFSFVFLASSFEQEILTSIIQGLNISYLMPFRPVPDIFGGSSWSPPFTTGGGLLGVNIQFFWLIASLIVLTLIPKLGDMIKGALSGRPYPAGTGIGEALGIAGAGAMFGAGAISALESGRWQNALKAQQQGLIKQIPARRQLVHNVMQGIRTMSGGRIR